MRPETKRKLDEIVRADRNLGRWATCLGVMLVIGFGMWFLRPTSFDQRLTATVRASRLTFDEESGRRWFNVESQLDSGRIVMATSVHHEPPASSSRIVLRRRTNLLGFSSYVWEGQRAAD